MPVPLLIAVPAATGLVTVDDGLGSAVLIGLWAHLLAVPSAVALGAWAGRAVTRHRGRGVLVLVAGAILAMVLGLSGSPVAFLAPPLMAAARLAGHDFGWGAAMLMAAHAVVWTGVAIGGYGVLRARLP